MKKLCIVYASLSGNTEDITMIVKESLKENYSVDLKLAEYTHFEDVLNYDGIILGTYTWNDGIIPFEFQQFYNSIDQRIKNKVIAVFGSGDMKYKFYCTAVDTFYSKLEKNGAIVLENKLKIELGPDNKDKISRIKTFAKDFEEIL